MANSFLAHGIPPWPCASTHGEGVKAGTGPWRGWIPLRRGTESDGTGVVEATRGCGAGRGGGAVRGEERARGGAGACRRVPLEYRSRASAATAWAFSTCSTCSRSRLLHRASRGRPRERGWRRRSVRRSFWELRSKRDRCQVGTMLPRLLSGGQAGGRREAPSRWTGPLWGGERPRARLLWPRGRAASSTSFSRVYSAAQSQPCQPQEAQGLCSTVRTLLEHLC